MPPESKTPFTTARRVEPEVFIEGIDVVIKRDLDKHKELLGQTQVERQAFEEARDHESKRKRYYYRQIGKGKYNDEALLRSVGDIRTNIRHLSDKVKLSKEKIEHHKLIVATLSAQLKDYNRRYAAFDRQRQQADPAH